MKKLVILLLCCEFTYLVNAQNYTQVIIETPNQTMFYADSLISGDLTSTEKNNAKNFWLNCYNNRIIYKGEATYKYNCHAYAWRVSDGGSKVWIDNPNDDNYWEDCSYVEVTNQAIATKVSFGGPCYQTWTTCNGTSYTNPCDHSAVTTSSTDYFISKWGPSPLFEHHKDDCPYSTEDLHYYSTMFISGPSTVCSSGSTFSVSNPPTIDSIIWSIGPNLTIYSGQNSNSPIIKATGSGNSWVQARLVTECGSNTLPAKNVWAGAPYYNLLDIDLEGGALIACDYTSAEADYNGTAGIDLYDWNLPSASDWDISEHGISHKYVEIEYWEDPAPSYEKITVRAHNTCGWSDWQETWWPVTDNCGYRLMSFSPNPTTGETTLTIQSSSEKEILDVNQEWDLEVYTQTQVLKAKKTRLKGSSTVINTAGWQEGVYVVRVLYNNEVITGKLIVKR